MVRRTRFISAIAISAYLAASIVPCDPPQALRNSMTILARDVAASATSAADVPETSRSPAAGRPGAEAHDHAAAGHAHSSRSGSPHSPHSPQLAAAPAPSGAQEHANHTHHHAATDGAGVHGKQAPAAVSSEAVPGRHGFATQFLKPQCLCGCNDARGWVGGGAARLGAAVPLGGVAKLIEGAAVPAAELRIAAFDPVVSEIDPIPI